MAEVPLFVPDEEDDAIPQVIDEGEGDEWEDFDGELEDVQMSIAIAQSLESRHHSMTISDTQPPAQAPVLGTPAKFPRQANVNEDEDDFTSPSRLATQLSIAGARKPLSTRIPSDSMRGTAALVTSTPSISPKKSTQNLVADPILNRPPVTFGGGDAGESDEDDMEEVSIPRAVENRPCVPDTEPGLEPLMSPDPALVTDPVEAPLAIGVEDAVAKRFVEFQKIFAEKRKAFRAENHQAQEEPSVTREVFRAESPGLEYADSEVEIIEVRERGKEPTKVKSSPQSQSDEDEDMEEVEVFAAHPSVPSRVPQSPVQFESAQSFQLPPASVPAVVEALPLKRGEENAGEDEEGVPISDWPRSPSPQPRPPGDEAGPSIPRVTLDRSRGLLDPDDSFNQGPSGEQDQEQEAFDAAHEMDPDAEAGEFARWMSQVKGRNLDDVRKEIEQEINGLRKEQKAAMRDSEDITGQMIAQIMVSLGHLRCRLSSLFWTWI